MKESNSSSTIVPFEKSLRIAGLQKVSTLDFPGCLAAVVFFADCNYCCYYCHNKRILDDPPLLPAAEVLGFLEKRAGLLDGVTLTGGEASLQQGLYSFARSLKELGYRVKLDTNGSRPDTVRAMLQDGLADYVAVDYKAPFSMYGDICGAGPEGVAETFRLLRESGAAYEVRVTVIPQITEKKLAEMAESLPRLKRFVLQLYRPVTEAGELRLLEGAEADGMPYTPGELASLAQAIKYAQPNVEIRA
ncbi:MAG: anaerobic ribonucleoside-triphosphate reductase activating protein [Clostridiales Family XIII bacterium]|jgi:pyruvate formate lyase activating enzyme|nr:anaerobic ribonucleoside-triphosphate reductase activating protein [Clostridiales Family XIII bacterium]